MNMSTRPYAVTPMDFPASVAIVRTFGEAATSYIENGGEAKYLRKIIPFLGRKMTTEIYPFDVRELAKELYPAQTNATRNRCVVTPIKAVCYHAYDRGWGPAVRIRNFKAEQPKRKKAASQAWLHAFVRQCATDGLPHVAALVLFMSQTGARVSEAIDLRWREVDLTARTALLIKTKTERNSTKWMPDQLVERLRGLKEGQGPDDRAFRYSSRYSVNERISAVCMRAGITYKPSHTCGRHAFANNSLAMGIDVKSVMEAGGWRSPVVFLGTYVNPRNAGRIVADRHNLYQFDNDL